MAAKFDPALKGHFLWQDIAGVFVIAAIGKIVPKIFALII